MKVRPELRQPSKTCSITFTAFLLSLTRTWTLARESSHGKSKKNGRPAVIAGPRRRARFGKVLLAGSSSTPALPVASTSGVIRSQVALEADFNAVSSPGIDFKSGT